jgi:hypothetical protein
MPVIWWIGANISEEHTASIFGVEYLNYSPFPSDKTDFYKATDVILSVKQY